MENVALYYSAQGVGGSGQQHGQSNISASVHLGVTAEAKGPKADGIACP